VRVPVDSDPKHNLEPHITSEVMFEIPRTNDRVSLGVLRRIYEMVSSDVIPRFARFLPESTGLVDRKISISPWSPP
jgi:hypothetical protein